MNFRPNLKKFNFLILLALGLFLLSCAKSPSGSIEELVKTRQPTFGGATVKSFTTPSQPFTLNGECDPISYDLLYSFNNSTWASYSGGCATGAFTLNFNVIGIARVYVRAQTKTGFTPTSIATIRLVLPPTSPYFAFVQSGQAGDEYSVTPATQNAVEINYTSSTMTNGLLILKPSLVDVIYGP